MLMVSAAVILSLTISPSVRGAGSAPVVVTNPVSQPVPGVGNLTGSISGNVNAAQSGQWDVSLTSGASVAVNNTATNPVPVTLAGAAEQTVRFKGHIVGGGGFGQFDPPVGPIPAGVRIVIKFMQFTVSTDKTFNNQFVRLTVNGAEAHNYFTPMFRQGDADFIVGSAQVFIPLEEGDRATFFCFGDITGGCNVELVGTMIAL
jgi:hypothetical protein